MTDFPIPDRDALPVVPFLDDPTVLPVGYEAHVRANGSVVRCPSWCKGHDHLRAAIYDRTDPGPWHRASRAEGETLAEGDVTVGRSSAGAPYLIVAGAEGLSASEARVLAAVLLNAADELDGISTR